MPTDPRRLHAFLLLACLSATTGRAALPLLTFAPLTPTTLVLAASETAVVRYSMTNHAVTTKTWSMQPIPGVTQLTTGSVCGELFTLAPDQACVLELQVDAAGLPDGLEGGPVVCVSNEPLDCYRPAPEDELHVTVVIFADGFE